MSSVEIKVKTTEELQKVAVSTFAFTPRLNVAFALGNIIHCTKKIKFSVKGLFSKYEQNSRWLQICSYLLKQSMTKNYIFCSVILDKEMPSQK